MTRENHQPDLANLPTTYRFLRLLRRLCRTDTTVIIMALTQLADSIKLLALSNLASSEEQREDVRKKVMIKILILPGPPDIAGTASGSSGGVQLIS